MPETNQKIYVDNVNGAAALVTSLKLFVQRPGQTKFEEIGTALRADIEESRDVFYNFVIGNSNDPGTARDLIPGLVRSSTMRLETVALYTKNILSALGDYEGLKWISSLKYQTRPFIIKEQIQHPNTDKILEITYEGCIMSRYSKTQNITGSDIRIMEDVTVAFKKQSVSVNQIDSDN